MDANKVPDTKAAWKAEEQRQADEFAEAINAALNGCTEAITASGRAPLVTAICGALVSAQGMALASIENPHRRKEVRKSMERMLPLAIARCATGQYAKSVEIDGKRH